MTSPSAEDLLARALGGAPLGPGPTRLLCIDGLAGAGKTTLAADLAAAAARSGRVVVVIHADDLLAGWSGLLAVGQTIDDDVVSPLARGETGRYRRYDWDTGEFGEWVEVAPADLLIVEGCGSAPPRVAERAALVVWVEAADEVRLARGLDRDGENEREHWLAWMRDEERLARRDATRERADVVIATG